MRNPKFQTFVGNDGDHYFRLKAGNGQIILQSEGYKDRGGCRNGMRSVRVNAPLDRRYERHEEAGHVYFNLRARNGQVIGNSQMYATPYSMECGIASVKANGPIERVDELD